MRACQQQLENGACRLETRSSRAKATQAHSCAELMSAACKRTWHCTSHRWPLRTRSNAQQRHAAAGGSQHGLGTRRAVARSAAAATSRDTQMCSRTTWEIRKAIRIPIATYVYVGGSQQPTSRAGSPTRRPAVLVWPGCWDLGTSLCGLNSYLNLCLITCAFF